MFRTASPGPGVNLAITPVIDMAMEDAGMPSVELGDTTYQGKDWPPMGGKMGPGKGRMLDCWKPSDRRRLGHLSFKAYEIQAMNCPTDLWSYQRLFIEQQRDGGNLWAPGTPRSKP